MKKQSECIKRINRAVTVLALTACIFVSGCGSTTDYESWLPEDRSNVENLLNGNYRIYDESLTDSSFAEKTYTGEEMAAALLEGRSDDLAYYLWQNQIASGLYAVTRDDIKTNSLVYYVSSSEGDDSNLGLTPDKPKKTLSSFEGQSNITVLLKCGDTFDMDGSYTIGSNCIFATYGQGSRPVLNYYIKLDLTYVQMEEYPNVWMADLTGATEIYTGEANKDNCNLGQMVVDGVVNWKRIVVSSAQGNGYDFAADVYSRADGCWTVDWINSILYVYSETDPADHDICFAPDHHGIKLSGVNNVTIKGLEIRGVGAHGINITDCTDIEISYCYLSNIGGSVHRSAGIRYGNGIQVWDSASNILITGNYADWIYDSCYTNQGSDDTCTGENIEFINNIGAHSFTGIETWGDTYSENDFVNLRYEGNILYYMCDITAPEVSLYAASSGKLIEDEEREYISYRGGYTYNQMTSINISFSKVSENLHVENNTVWNTMRLMLIISGTESGEPSLVNNYFYSEYNSEGACFFRYTDASGSINYVNSVPEQNNYVKTYFTGEEYDNSDELSMLTAAMENIIKGAEE